MAVRERLSTRVKAVAKRLPRTRFEAATRLAGRIGRMQERFGNKVFLRELEKAFRATENGLRTYRWGGARHGGAAPIIHEGKHYPPQTLELGRQMFEVARRAIAHVEGFNPTHVITLHASATTAGDAVINSLNAEKSTVVKFGAFGDRISIQVRRQGKQLDTIEFPYGQAPNWDVIIERINRFKPSVIYFTDVETGTGAQADSSSGIRTLAASPQSEPENTGSTKAATEFLGRLAQSKVQKSSGESNQHPLIVVDGTSMPPGLLSNPAIQSLPVVMYRSTAKGYASALGSIVAFTESGLKWVHKYTNPQALLSLSLMEELSAQSPALAARLAGRSDAGLSEFGRARYTQDTKPFYEAARRLRTMVKEGGPTEFQRRRVVLTNAFEDVLRHRLVGYSKFVSKPGSASMLHSFVVPPHLLAGSKSKAGALIERLYRKYGLEIQMGYSGAKPSDWKSTQHSVLQQLDEPHTGIIRLNTYFPTNKECKKYLTDVCRVARETLALRHEQEQTANAGGNLVRIQARHQREKRELEDHLRGVRREALMKLRQG